MRQLLRYVGSKTRMSKQIISMMPEHHTYVEVFGGSAAILMKKPPDSSKQEVLNDKDGNLTTYYRVLRDRPTELAEAIERTPYSRDEFFYCRDKLKENETTDEVELARRVFVNYWQGFGGRFGGGFGYGRTMKRGQEFRNRADDVVEWTERLKHVVIENGDFEQILKRYDHPHSLLYFDPPYLTSTRNMAGDACYCTPDEVCIRCRLYREEMADDEHERMLKLLLSAQGKIILSGYDSEMYSDYLRGWNRMERELIVLNGIGNNRNTRIANEVIWTNFGEKRTTVNLPKEIPMMNTTIIDQLEQNVAAFDTEIVKLQTQRKKFVDFLAELRGEVRSASPSLSPSEAREVFKGSGIDFGTVPQQQQQQKGPPRRKWADLTPAEREKVTRLAEQMKPFLPSTPMTHFDIAREAGIRITKELPDIQRNEPMKLLVRLGYAESRPNKARPRYVRKT